MIENIAKLNVLSSEESDQRLRFLDLWLVGTLMPIALEILGDFLKSLLPSQKKKKKGSEF